MKKHNSTSKNKPILLVMAAGMGSRYGGIKQIDSVGANNETLLDYSIYDALKAGFGKIVFVIRRDIEKDFRERLFDRIAKNADASYVFQEKTGFVPNKYLALAEARKKPWGTIQCVLSANKYLDGDFATLNSDDFYGRQAFELMTGHFKDSSLNVLIGYYLKNTLSLSGGVTRGVCSLDGEFLQGLRETYKIKEVKKGLLTAEDESANPLSLTGEEVASMNFFGFNKDVLTFFEKYWSDFIQKNASEEKAECLLPNAVGDMIKSGYDKMKVYMTDEKWFGMTYPEDKMVVHDAISALVKNSTYPERLWEYY